MNSNRILRKAAGAIRAHAHSLSEVRMRSLWTRTLMAVGLTAVLAGGASAAAKPESFGGGQAASMHIVASAQVNFADLARQQEQARRAGLLGAPVRPRIMEGDDDFNEGHADAAPGPYSGPTVVSPQLNIASPSPTNSFIGLDDIPMADSSYIVIPPDVGGGVGPTRVMDTFNNNYRIQDKSTGATILTVGTATFWNPVITNKTLLNQLTDPRTTYDPVQGRWLTCMMTANATGLIVFGVSQTSDPGGSWFLYAVTPGFTGSPRLDFPVLGFNKDWIAVTINAYTSAGLFNRGGCMIANYPQAAAGTLASVTNVTQTAGSHFCTAPCATISATEDTLFLVLRASTSTIEIDRITGVATISGGTATYTSGTAITRTGGTWAVPTSGNLLPQSAPNSGTSSCGATPCTIESADDNIRSTPIYRVDSTTGRGFIYFTQTVGLPSASQTHTAVQWTKFTASSSPAFADGGRIEDATATATNGGKWYAYPSIAVNSVGDWLIGYSQFSSAQHPAAGYSYHDHTDALGSMRDPLVYKAGEDYYHKAFTTGRNRWGDFTTAQVDPSDDKTLWTLEEYPKTRATTDDGTTGSNASKWSSYWASVQSGFTITASAGAGGSISPSGSVSVAAGGSQTFTITPNACFSIAGVTVDGVSQGAVSSYTFSNVSANHTISATFLQNAFTIVASAGANGSISPSGNVNVLCGNSQAFTITPAACYSVASVTVDGGSVGAVTSYTFSNVQANHTISATFALNTYTIVASAGANGSISPSGNVSVNCGSNQSFTITPNACYSIAGVTVDGSSVGAVASYTFSNVQANHTISASFAINTYTIVASAGANGSISPSGNVSVNCGSNQAFSISANSNYYVQDVQVDGGSVGAVASYTFNNVQTNHSVSATFAQDLATIGAQSTSSLLCPTNTCVTIPVTLSRLGGTPVLGYSVSFQLSPELQLCNGNASIVEGSFLNSTGSTLFNVINHGGGLYSVDDAQISNCGPTATSGTLFTIALASSSPSGPGTVTITSLKLRDCSNVALSTAAGPPATVPIDNAPPSVAVTSPNGGESWVEGTSQNITWTATDNVGVANVDLAYSTDGGATYPNVIATAIANSGSYAWTVPNTPTTTARVRVTAHDVNCSSASDASDADFTISPPTRTIFASAGAGGSISPSGAVTVAYGGSQSFTITPDGCHAISDVLVDGSSVGAVASYTFSNVTTDHTIAASFSLDSYTIVASAGAGGSISPNGNVSVGCGSDQAFTIAADGCHTIDKVFVDGSSVGAVSSYTFSNVTANHTITATFSVNSFTIVASAGVGGFINPSGNVPVSCGSNATFLIKDDGCHTIADVQVDGSSVGAVSVYTFSNVTADHTINATFSLNTYTIVASTGSGGTINPSGNVSVNCGSDQAFTIAADGCHTIADVLVDGSSVGSVSSYTFSNVTTNHTIAASFSLNSYTIVASAGAGGSISPSGNVSVNCGSDQSFTISANSCYAIADVVVDGSSIGAVSSYTFSNVTANHTIAASFSLNSYTIVASAGAGGSISPSGNVSVGCGSDQAFTISGDACHSIADVVVDGGSVGAVASYTFSNVTANHTITASFVIKVYTIAASAGVGGSISPSGNVSVNCSTNQSFTITPGSCYSIADVQVDGGSVGAVASYTFSNVTANHTIAASFSLNAFTIVASAGSGGSITPSGNVSVNCGANQSFTIAGDACHSIADVQVDGGSVGAVASYTFNNVTANHTITASFASNASTVGAVTALSSAQVKSGNDASGTTKITLTFTAPGGASSVEVWRKGFGSYPTYDDGGGSVPSAPASYPPAGWTLTAVTASGQTDHPATRDFWYYVAYAKDACGAAGPVSNVTSGTLDYHLGDVSNGVTPGQGDNTVSTADVSLLGSHYGGSSAGFEYLDVGPTTDRSTNARPTTDNKVDFEDLVMFALNYTPHVSLAAKPVGPHAATADGISLVAPEVVNPGDAFDVPVNLAGAGDLQALSVTLGWNSAIVQPTGVDVGDLVASQGGVVLSPGPGRADAALLGAGQGMTGQGAVAIVHFVAVAAGVPRVSIASVTGRNSQNQDVAVAITNPLAVSGAAASTQFAPIVPNPSRGAALLQYSLAKAGPVNLAIYSVDGRLVKSVVHDQQGAGNYSYVWNGTDEHGVMVKSGLFYARFEAIGVRKTRLLTLVR